jgi:hypothetical protein
VISRTPPTIVYCAQAHFLFGEHRAGRPGEGRYLTLKEFETAYAVFRGQLAQGIDPQPTSAGPGKRRRFAQATALLVEETTMVTVDQIPEPLRKLFPGPAPI